MSMMAPSELIKTRCIVSNSVVAYGYKQYIHYVCVYK